MATYSIEEKLNLAKKVYITQEVFNLLREEKKKQNISMAKIVSNLVLEKYGNQNQL
jgi:hypothetical protein